MPGLRGSHGTRVSAPPVRRCDGSGSPGLRSAPALPSGGSGVTFPWEPAPPLARMSGGHMLLFPLHSSTRRGPKSGPLKSTLVFLWEWSERNISLLVVAVGRRAWVSLQCGHTEATRRSLPQLSANHSERRPWRRRGRGQVRAGGGQLCPPPHVPLGPAGHPRCVLVVAQEKGA